MIKPRTAFAIMCFLCSSIFAHAQKLPKHGTRFWLTQNDILQLEFNGDSVKATGVSFADSEFFKNNGYFANTTSRTSPRRAFDSLFSVIHDRFHQFPRTLNRQELDSARMLPNIQTISKENFIKYLTECDRVQKAIPFDQEDMPSMMYYFSECRMLALYLSYSPFFTDQDFEHLNTKFKDDADLIRLEHSLGN